MTEHPIIFSAPMVRAILAKTKTQTRRIVKPQPVEHDFLTGGIHHSFVPPQTKPGYLAVGVHVIKKGDTAYLKRLPYGIPGDHLWVRETHSALHGCVEYRADRKTELDAEFPWAHIYDEKTRWTPSIFMRRMHSRITLEITDVRVERLQEISEADAKAEGVRGFVEDGCWVYEDYVHGRGTWSFSARGSYSSLWETISGPESWGSNPWVWVIAFKQVAP